jgi:trigger factor
VRSLDIGRAMQIDIEKKSYCEIIATITATSDEVAKKIDSVLPIFKGATVTGYRPGKAPVIAIKAKYGTQINDAVRKGLNQDAYHELLTKLNVKPFGYPDIIDSSFDGKSYSSVLRLLHKPEFTLNAYKDFVMPAPKSKNVNDELERVKETICMERGVPISLKYEDVIATHDRVTMSYTSSVDGIKVPELESESETFIIGTSELIGFDEALIGKPIDFSGKITVTAPSSSLPVIANKEVTLSVNVISVSRMSPVNFDDELAKSFSFEDAKAFEEALRQTVLKHVNDDFADKTSKLIHARLCAENPVEIPDFMLEKEAQYLAGKNNMKWVNLPEEIRKAFMTLAYQNVQLSLICESVRETDLGMLIPETELQDRLMSHFKSLNIEQMSSFEKIEPTELLRHLAKLGLIDIVKERISNEYTLGLIVGTCKFTN